MRMFMFAVPVVALIVVVVGAISRSSVKARCTAGTGGTLVDTDSSAEGTGGGIGRAVYYAIYFPIYEYVVDGMAYWAKIDMRSSNPVGFAKTVTVMYDPVRPEICYIDGLQGKIVSTYDKDEYICLGKNKQEAYFYSSETEESR